MVSGSFTSLAFYPFSGKEDPPIPTPYLFRNLFGERTRVRLASHKWPQRSFLRFLYRSTLTRLNLTQGFSPGPNI